MMLKNYNNILLFKELIEICERILVYRFERNEGFLIQLIKHYKVLLKSMKLKFSKRQMGLFYYPALYTSTDIKHGGKELTEQEKEDILIKREEAKRKFSIEELQAIDFRLEEMADWFNKNYKSIVFTNFLQFYKKVEQDIVRDELDDDVIETLNYTDIAERLRSRSSLGEFFIQANSGVIYNINFSVGDISRVFESF